MAYTKLFSTLITSTIWTEDDQTRIVWITMLALADANGEVQGSIPGLARVAGVPVDKCRAAIAKFLEPDPDSRTKDADGRRIAEIDGGWEILTYAKHRAMASDYDRAAKAAERQARFRARQADAESAESNASVTPRNALSRPVTPRNAPVTQSNAPSRSVTPASRQIPQAEADTEKEKETKEKESPPFPPAGGVDSHSVSDQGSKDTDPPDFTEFWSRYPRKEAKPAARKAWKSLKASQKAAALADDPKARYAETEAPYIPHPATYLRQERYMDPPPPKLNGTTVKKPLRGVNHGILCAQQALEIQPNNDMDRMYAEALAYDAMIAAEAAKEAESAALAGHPEPEHATVP